MAACVATIIVLVVSAVQLVLAPVIELAFGAEFAPAIACARWLVLADGLLGFRRVLIMVLQMRGRGGVASWIEFSLTALLVGGIVAPRCSGAWSWWGWRARGRVRQLRDADRGDLASARRGRPSGT